MSHAASVDSQLFELFDCVAEYQQLRHSSSSTLRQAFFDLALAKRSAGYRWISPDLYNGRAHAIATVAIDEEYPNDLRVMRSNTHAEASSSNPEQTHSAISDSDKEGNVIRRRRRRLSNRDESESADPAASNDNEEDGDLASDGKVSKKQQRSVAANDPLLWFGMLVPPSLKEAQSGFATSLDCFVQLAQLKRRLMQQQQEIQQACEAQQQQQ
ncbi:hypothetical protein GGF42_005023 [Coemansia sp. RSA 2424]|nr:hypothetical protein GGF42_005023 [Coemansia sp. RSA 2424]